jgi:hypothetical protein
VTGGPRVTSDPRPVVTSSTTLFLNFFPVTVSPFIYFNRKDFEKNIATVISYSVFHTSITHVTDFKILLHMCFPGKICVKYKLLQQQTPIVICAHFNNMCI